MKDKKIKLIIIILGIIVIALFVKYTQFNFFIKIMFGGLVGCFEYVIANYILKKINNH